MSAWKHSTPFDRPAVQRAQLISAQGFKVILQNAADQAAHTGYKYLFHFNNSSLSASPTPNPWNDPSRENGLYRSSSSTLTGQAKAGIQGI